MSERELFLQMLRSHFPAFIEQCFRTVEPGGQFRRSWYINAMARQLERCAIGEVRRLIINLPPRYLKSMCASVAFPAWLLGHDPSLRIIIVCYARELVGSLARNIRQIMAADWYRAAFPGTRLSDIKNTEFEFQTTQGGYVLATSVGGTLTGRGGDVIIIDDPLKAQDAHSEKERKSTNDWFSSTLLSRLNDKMTGRIVLVAQRLHVDDLVGNVLPKGHWETLSIPAIAVVEQRYEVSKGAFHTRPAGDVLQPEREDRTALEAARQGLGSLNYSAQYQQDPQPAGGNLIKRDWLKFYNDLPLPIERLPQVFSLDPAWTITEQASYSVLTRWAVHDWHYYLLDVWRDRAEMPALRKMIREAYRHHRPEVILIERVSSNLALAQDLRAEGLRVLLYPLSGDKLSRLATQTARIEQGRVHLPEGASWLDAFMKEVLAFPSSPHDDQVDSMSQFLTWASWKEKRMNSHRHPGFQRREINRRQDAPRREIERRPW